MKKRILDYIKRIDTILTEQGNDTDWQAVLEEHLIQVSFFQHERLIHLIVMSLIALLTMISVAVLIIAQYIPMLLLTALFIVLLIPYIKHYYLLENGVQYMYGQYDEILKRIRK